MGKLIHKVYETAMIFVIEMNVHINGSVSIVRNQAWISILKFKSCDVSLNGKLLFDSNYCSEVLSLDTYMKVTEDSNITFVNNKYQNNLIVVGNADNYYKPYPFCIFQYIAVDKNIKVKDLLTHYTVTFTENSHFTNAPNSSNNCSISFCHFISHCKWIASAVFYDYSPVVVNQQVIQNDDQNCHYQKHLCYCSENINCVNDKKRCELFLTASPFLNKLYDVFYVQILGCPIGFSLQDGVCQCDPILPENFQSCIIDHSAIRRPANTWITAYTHKQIALNI